MSPSELMPMTPGRPGRRSPDDSGCKCHFVHPGVVHTASALNPKGVRAIPGRMSGIEPPRTRRLHQQRAL
eukprot:634225-Alexandrium_andersonii.AAC.1